MAMLAAPRRKQKVINLRAKNNAWSNDSNKFGQRMLEKMGWSEGKGLGANENGIVEHVVARYKNDDKGLGFEDRNDQWTKHEDDFNSLLANLSNGDKKDEKLHSGVSLEVKSKKSKARVHYHKFTRGKDLTRYSEKDLANIFGKKSLKNEEKLEEIVKEDDDIKTTEQVFTDKGSMVDYFKNKLASFKSKNKYVVNGNDNIHNDRSDCAFKGFSGTGSDNKETENQLGFGFQGFSFYNSEDIKNEKENTESEVCVESSKKSKKKKKNKNREIELDNTDIVENTIEKLANDEDISEIVPEEKEKVKRSKKKKLSIEIQEPVEEPLEIKKLKKKNKVLETIDEHTTEDYVPKKKKKRKNKEVENE